MGTALPMLTLTALGSAVLSTLLRSSRVHHRAWCCSHGPIVRSENSTDRRNFSTASSAFTANRKLTPLPKQFLIPGSDQSIFTYDLTIEIQELWDGIHFQYTTTFFFIKTVAFRVQFQV